MSETCKTERNINNPTNVMKYDIATAHGVHVNIPQRYACKHSKLKSQKFY